MLTSATDDGGSYTCIPVGSWTEVNRAPASGPSVIFLPVTHIFPIIDGCKKINTQRDSTALIKCKTALFLILILLDIAGHRVARMDSYQLCASATVATGAALVSLCVKGHSQIGTAYIVHIGQTHFVTMPDQCQHPWHFCSRATHICDAL